MPRQSESLAREKKTRLVIAAVNCFIQKGFHRSSMRDIAAEANTSLGNLYNYFPGKEALIDALALMESEELMPLIDILECDRKPEWRIRRFVTRYLRYLGQPENVALALEFAAEAIRNPAILDSFKPNRDRLEQSLAETIAQLQGNRRRDSRLARARLLLDMIEGTAIRNVMYGAGRSNGSAATILAMLGHGSAAA